VVRDGVTLLLRSDPSLIIIGSADFTESQLIASIYSQALQAAGVSVKEQFNIGSREVYVAALKDSSIDLVPEYSGAFLSYLDPKSTAATAEAVTTELKGKLPSGISMLTPSPAEDKDVLAVTKATADKYKLVKLSDLAPIGNQLVMGGPAECPNREFCALGLKNKYGITFKEFKALDTGGPLTVQALVGGQIDVGLLFTSDSTIAVRGFILLEDDKQLQLSDNVAPVVRNDYLSKAGDDFKKVVNSIAPKLTTAELTGMNKLVEVDKKDPKDVAKEWLKKQGLIK